LSISANWQAEAALSRTNEITTAGTTIIVTKPPVSTFNRTSKRTVTVPGDTVYTGPAYISLMTNADKEAFAEDQLVNSRVYVIALPVDTTGIELGHQVRVNTSPDVELVGQLLVVQSAEHGTRRLSRTFYATTSDSINPPTA